MFRKVRINKGDNTRRGGGGGGSSIGAIEPAIYTPANNSEMLLAVRLRVGHECTQISIPSCTSLGGGEAGGGGGGAEEGGYRLTRVSRTTRG